MENTTEGSLSRQQTAMNTEGIIRKRMNMRITDAEEHPNENSANLHFCHRHCHRPILNSQLLLNPKLTKPKLLRLPMLMLMLVADLLNCRGVNDLGQGECLKTNCELRRDQRIEIDSNKITTSNHTDKKTNETTDRRSTCKNNSQLSE